MAVCGHLLIVAVVGPCGQLSEVVEGYHCHALMVVLGTCEHWWVVVAIP